LADDPEFPLDVSQLQQEISTLQTLPMAERQVETLLERIKVVVETQGASGVNFQEII